MKNRRIRYYLQVRSPIQGREIRVEYFTDICLLMLLAPLYIPNIAKLIRGQQIGASPHWQSHNGSLH